MIVGVSRKQVLVQLDDGQVERLDALADATDNSRSELIRRAIDLYVEAIEEAVAEVRYADAYRLTPEDLGEFAALRALGARAWPKD
jgi:predicted transcriptional regulator